MTSNVGSQWIQELGSSQREEMEARISEALRAQFKPEFLNRIDETIIFQNLTPDEIVRIVDIQIQRLASRLADNDITLILSNGAKQFIAEKGYDPVYGARPLKRVIQQCIENPLSMEILKGTITPGSTISAEVRDDQVVFQTK
jgi:ATP-dependent Clp protease ATP-binding subunit ClpB